MKSQLAKSVADHIIAQNEKNINQIIYLKKNLKKYQDKMMQALDKLTSTLSTKIKDYKKLLLFEDPYDCLNVFVQQITKSASYSVITSSQNDELLRENNKLSKQIKKIQEESQQRIRKQEEIIEELNNQIDLKKQRLIQLQDDYQNLLQAKKIAQRELSQTKQHMKILRLKLYEQQRQKLTQIIVANKKQMVDFRRSMQMQAYKQQLEFKKQISQKDHEIKLLTKNIEELINSNLTSTSDLTVLQKIVKPMRQSTQLKDQLSALKKQISSLKHQIRQKQSVVLGLQGQNADITMNRDNLKSQNQRLQIEKNLLTNWLADKTEQLQKAIKDRKALDLYYTEKWHSEFSKVKQNLQQKYHARTRQLTQQYEQKRKQVQAQIEAYLERLRIMKNEMSVLIHKNQQLSQLNEILNKTINDKERQFIELKCLLRQSQHFHNENLLGKQIYWQQQRLEIDNLLRQATISSNKYEMQLNRVISENNIERCNMNRQKLLQLQRLRKQNLQQIGQLQKKHGDELRQLQRSYSNSKQAIQAFRIAQQKKFEQKQKSIYQRHQQQLKQVDRLCQSKLIKLNQKINQSDLKYQKLRKRRQDQSQQADRKISDLQKVLYQRDHQLVSRDVEIQQYKKMKDKYLTQIKQIHLQLNQQSFQRQSLEVQLQSAEKQLSDKSQIIKQLQNKKYQFKEDIKSFEKQYKYKIQQLNAINKKITHQYKKKITELQKLFEKRPIKKQHYQHIQSLQKTNLDLKTQIHIKQAQNLILNQVKDYYQQKAIQKYHNLNSNSNQQQKLFLSTNVLFKKTNTNMKQTIKLGQKPVFVKKYSNRKNKLISNSIKKIQYQDQSQKQYQFKQVTDMKRYLSKQNRINNISSSFSKNDRSKSSMM